MIINLLWCIWKQKTLNILCRLHNLCQFTPSFCLLSFSIVNRVILLAINPGVNLLPDNGAQVKVHFHHWRISTDTGIIDINELRCETTCFTQCACLLSLMSLPEVVWQRWFQALKTWTFPTCLFNWRFIPDIIVFVIYGALEKLQTLSGRL